MEPIAKYHLAAFNLNLIVLGMIGSITFDPQGEKISTIDIRGSFFVSDISSDECNLNKQMGQEGDFCNIFLSRHFALLAPIVYFNRVRWNPLPSSPCIAVKFGLNKFNVVEMEKAESIYKEPLVLDRGSNTVIFAMSLN